MKKKISERFLYDKSKELLKKFLVKYSIIALMVLVLEALVIALMLLANKAIGQKVGIAFISIDAIAAMTYLLILDLDPARRLRKNKFTLPGNKMTKEQGIVFYNFLKYRSILRLIINLIIIVVMIILTLTWFVY